MDIAKIPPTSISTRVFFDPPRTFSIDQFRDITRWINDLRSDLQPWNISSVTSKLSQQTPEDLLEEISTIARNTIQNEPLPFIAGLFPVHVLNDNGELSWVGINSRDHKQAAKIFLENIKKSILPSLENNPDKLKNVAIAFGEFQNYLHHLSDGNGRLSRMLVAIYWPDTEPYTTDQIARLFDGSTSIIDNYKSFTDPTVNLQTTVLVEAFNLERIPNTNSLNIYCLDSWERFFPNDLQLVSTLEEKSSYAADNYIKACMQSSCRYYGIDENIQGALTLLHTGVDPHQRGIELNPVEQQGTINFSDWHEISIAKTWMPATLYILDEIVKKYPQADPQTVGDVIQLISQLTRTSRLHVLDTGIDAISNKDIKAIFLDNEPPMADVLTAQYDDGIEWIRTGIITERGYDKLRLRTYPRTAEQIEVFKDKFSRQSRELTRDIFYKND